MVAGVGSLTVVGHTQLFILYSDSSIFSLPDFLVLSRAWFVVGMYAAVLSKL